MNAPRAAGRRRVLAAIAALVAAPLAARAQDPRSSLAHRAALEWLALTDAGDAAGSWKAASELFRRAGADEQRWSEALAKFRAPLGATVARTLVATQFQTEIAGLPDKGDYVIMLYRTAFTARTDATERVTVERGRDGVYRVVGYSLQ